MASIGDLSDCYRCEALHSPVSVSVPSSSSGTGTELVYFDPCYTYSNNLTSLQDLYFYISARNNIASRCFDGNIARWTNNSLSYPSLPNVSAIDGSRALSVLPNWDYSVNGQWTTHVLYHNADSNVSWAVGSWYTNSTGKHKLCWQFLDVLAPQINNEPLSNSSGSLSLEILRLPTPVLQATSLTCHEKNS